MTVPVSVCVSVNRQTEKHPVRFYNPHATAREKVQATKVAAVLLAMFADSNTPAFIKTLSKQKANNRTHIGFVFPHELERIFGKTK